MASAFVMTALPLLAHALPQQNSSPYWVNLYGALSEADHPLVSRIQEVFQRVLNAADKRGNRIPNLIILREIENPWAFCLKDGSVLLSQRAAEFCYQDVKKSVGDARMAFVLGHELAHLSSDDFWGTEAFQTLANFGPENPVTDTESVARVRDILFKSKDPAIRKAKELKADAYGLLYASIAGYSPQHIVDTEGKNFFQHWTDQITKQIAYSEDAHPEPKARATLLLSKMNAVKEQVYLFQMGVRLYQLGRYEDALDFMEVFQEEFPCREVFSNIGLIYYQKAMKELAECDRNRAYRFRPSVVLDTETRAETFLRKCGEDLFRKSVRYFRHACKQDTLYATARVNLSAALILSEKHSEALSVLDVALKIQKDDPRAMNNRAIAMYLLGPSIQTDMFQQASDVLKAVIAKHPEYSDAYYNLGRIQAERERNAALRETWGKYLETEPFGIYSDIVRESLQKEKPSPETRRSAPAEFTEACPVKLGETDDETERQLAKFDEHTPDLRRTFGKCYVRGGVRVLVLEDVVEVVETPVRKAMRLSEITSKYGQPCRKHPAPSGVTTLVYDNFALDIQDDMVRKVTHFVVPIAPHRNNHDE